MKNDQMVASRLPRDLVKDLELVEQAEQTDRSTTVRKLLYRAVGDWKRDHFARQYGDGRVTLARAASDAGVSIWEMMDYVRQKRIGAQYDIEDLAHDLRLIENAVAQRRSQPKASRRTKRRPSAGAPPANRVPVTKPRNLKVDVVDLLMEERQGPR